ncbi:DNA recombination protein RmuC [Sphaerimonospora sp. CA-214678]|uniref:DNA recombination protein RmuC n=1 Tax=Sphaerimonospora sp. CA-214678 TaxID=3240029 RepID=UPI003D91753E
MLLSILLALACAAIAYLVARSRTAAERADLKVAQEQQRQAHTQMDDLRSERDKAQERAAGLEREHIEAFTKIKTSGEEIVGLKTTLEATYTDLRRCQAEAEGLKASLKAERERFGDADRRFREAQTMIAALEARETELRGEIQRLKEQLRELTAQKQGLQEQAVRLDAVRKELDETREQNNRLLEETLRATAADMLKQSQTELVARAEATLGAVSEPVKDQLAQMDRQLKDFSTTRAAAEAKLDQQLANLTEEGVRTRQETRKLVEALKKPQVRGQWGEMHLKRTAELAGLVEHCDFDLQVHIVDEDTTLRPDMRVNLSGGKHVIVDAKVPMDAFMRAIEASDEAEASGHWADHAQQLRKHVDTLGSKEYFRRVAGSPEFVALFVPGDAFLQPALDRDPTLLEYAVSKQVLIVTPTSLIAMLRTIAYAWTQAALRDNLKRVYELGRELYERLSAMGGHLDKLGRALDQSVKAYNKTVGSMEGRVMVTARKFHTLKLVEDQLRELHAVEQTTRHLGSPELTESAAADLSVRALPAPAGDDRHS